MASREYEWFLDRLRRAARRPEGVFDPCLRCGFCCKKTTCHFGWSHGSRGAPCDFLVGSGPGDYSCGLIERGVIEPGAIYAGQGCSSALNTDRYRLERQRRGSGAMPDKPVLIVQCGAKKLDRRAKVRDLYLGPFWSTYRARRREQDGLTGEHSELSVYVLSAKHGLVHELDELEPYDMMVVPAGAAHYTRRSTGSTRAGTATVPADWLAKTVKRQAKKLDLAGRRVFFVGGAAYAEALRLAGVEFESLSDGGLLAKRSALSGFLKEHESSGTDDSMSLLARLISEAESGKRS